MTRYRCPVCHRDVFPTKQHNLIRPHCDNARNRCEASLEPFRIAEDMDSIPLGRGA